MTGDREVTTTLTVSEKDASGAQKWSLGKGTLYDVTHLPCRSARYTPAGGTCQPTNELELEFPVRPGAAGKCSGRGGHAKAAENESLGRHNMQHPKRAEIKTL